MQGCFLYILLYQPEPTQSLFHLNRGQGAAHLAQVDAGLGLAMVITAAGDE